MVAHLLTAVALAPGKRPDLLCAKPKLFGMLAKEILNHFLLLPVHQPGKGHHE
jgi:hypothetical protein